MNMRSERNQNFEVFKKEAIKNNKKCDEFAFD
jgi:hypothetical protein